MGPNGSENFNFQNFKIPQPIFVRTIRKKIQEKFENFRLRFVGGVANFEIFAPIAFTRYKALKCKCPGSWPFKVTHGQM